jgi:YgiT-type zinc finger domain-containing protein
MKTQLTIKTCPNCGSDQIAKVCRDWIGEYQGQSYTVPDLEFYECPVCEERVFDRAAVAKLRQYSPAYHQDVKAQRQPATAAVAAR